MRGCVDDEVSRRLTYNEGGIEFAMYSDYSDYDLNAIYDKMVKLIKEGQNEYGNNQEFNNENYKKGTVRY